MGDGGFKVESFLEPVFLLSCMFICRFLLKTSLNKSGIRTILTLLATTRDQDWFQFLVPD